MQWSEKPSEQTALTCRKTATKYTVRLGKMAQHARLWALFMAKLKGQSQNASNIVFVEVACSYTSLGHAILPKAVRFRGIIIILCIGNNDTALVPFV